jgi:hypothetical protein
MEDLQLSLFANFDSGNMARYERVYKQQATSNTGTNNNTSQSNPVATNNNTTNSTSTNSNGKSSTNNTGKKNNFIYIRVKSQRFNTL